MTATAASASPTRGSPPCAAVPRKPLRDCVRQSGGDGAPDGAIDRDHDPAFATIRNEPEFKAVFADIERDMAQQRARLAARPKDAPLELTDASR